MLVQYGGHKVHRGQQRLLAVSRLGQGLRGLVIAKPFVNGHFRLARRGKRGNAAALVGSARW